MTKKQFYIILSLLLVAILIFSNPSEEVHIQSVKSKLKIAFKKKMSSEIVKNQNDAFSSLGNGLSLLLGDSFIDKLTDGFVTRENFFLFSLTKAEFKGEEKTIGFGILGNVFLTDKIENVFKENEDNEIKIDEKSENESHIIDVVDEPKKDSNITYLTKEEFANIMPSGRKDFMEHNLEWIEKTHKEDTEKIKKDEYLSATDKAEYLKEIEDDYATRIEGVKIEGECRFK